MYPKIRLVLLALSLGAFPNPAARDGIPAGPRLGDVSPATRQQILATYGGLPLAFVPNAGQVEADITLYAQGPRFRFAFRRREALVTMAETSQGKASGVSLALQFLGARPEVEPRGGRQGAGTVNYLLGNDPARWRTNLPTYEEVVYEDLWSGIDLIFRGAGSQLKYELVLRPGADVAEVRLAYRGAESLSLDGEGNLLVNTARGTLTDARPLAYQEIDGSRVPVASGYRLGKEETYGFVIGAYDRGHPLVIDPGLTYSTYLGGTEADYGFGIAVDAAGNAYVTGVANSPEFPTEPGAFDTTYHGGFSDVFVTKLDVTGSTLVYSTFLGGSDQEGGIAIHLDAAANAYVTGYTHSSDFPSTMGAFDTTHNGGFSDVFVTKLDATGSALVYSTYVGGIESELALDIAVDAFGNAYVTGDTFSQNFPATPGAFDTTFDGSDAFVVKLDGSGSTLVYSTSLGGSASDRGNGIAVDPSGDAYVVGDTGSNDFPTTPGAFSTTYNPAGSAFVTKLNSDGSAPLIYSTYLGGSWFDLGNGIAVDADGVACVTGETFSTDFPTTAGALDTTFNGMSDAFVTCVDASGSTMLSSTYLGGTAKDVGRGVAIDAAGKAYVTGYTASTDFPTTLGAFDTTFNGGRFDMFVTKVDASSSALLYSTYLGGTWEDFGSGIAVDDAGNAFLAGESFSTNFPTTPDAFDRTFNGYEDAIVVKLDTVGAIPTTVTLSPVAAVKRVGTSHRVTATVGDASGERVPEITVSFSVTGAVTTTGQCTTNRNGRCRFIYAGPTAPGLDVISAFADMDGDSTKDADEPTGTATNTWTRRRRDPTPEPR